ncbi:MAG: redoxin family protein [Reichenbachiella sp.]
MKTLLKATLFLLLTLNSGTSFSQEMGDEAPDFTLEKLGGGSFTLSDHSGKVVFIFFFGAGCPHCVSNGPNTENVIYKVYKDHPDFVAIGADTWDYNESGVANYRSSTGITYPLGLMAGELEPLFDTTYDRMIVIDKDGIIRYKSTANATTSVVADAADVVKTYLAMDASGGGDNGGGDNGGGDNGGGDNGGGDNGGGDNGMNGGGDTVTSIEKMDELNDISVYPIPAQNQITIKSEAFLKNDATISIYTMTGQLVLQKKVTQRNNNYSTLSIPLVLEGLNFVEISFSNQQTIRKKLIISK